MSKVVKAVVGTVLKLKCPECAEVFDLSWDIVEDIVDAATGEVIPWFCSRCQKSKKNENIEDDGLTSDRRLSLSPDKNSHTAKHNQESETNIDYSINKTPEIIYTGEEIKKDISEIKVSIIEMKQELEQLRMLIANRPDG